MNPILRVHLGWLHGSWQSVPFPSMLDLERMDITDVVAATFTSFCTRLLSKRTTLRFEIPLIDFDESHAGELYDVINAFVDAAATQGISRRALVRPTIYIRFATAARGTVQMDDSYLRADYGLGIRTKKAFTDCLPYALKAAKRMGTSETHTLIRRDADGKLTPADGIFVVVFVRSNPPKIDS